MMHRQADLSASSLPHSWTHFLRRLPVGARHQDFLQAIEQFVSFQRMNARRLLVSPPDMLASCRKSTLPHDHWVRLSCLERH